jgi:hypothetical protein
MKAECIRGETGVLTVGKIYEVENSPQPIINDDRWYLTFDDGYTGHLAKDRFRVIASEKIYAVCINDTASMLEKGITDEVEQHPTHSIRFIVKGVSNTDCDLGEVGWMKSRFKVLDSGNSPKQTLAKSYGTQTEIPEWKLSARVQPNECPCGVLKSLCSYHS